MIYELLFKLFHNLAKCNVATFWPPLSCYGIYILIRDWYPAYSDIPGGMVTLVQLAYTSIRNCLNFLSSKKDFLVFLILFSIFNEILVTFIWQRLIFFSSVPEIITCEYYFAMSFVIIY